RTVLDMAKAYLKHKYDKPGRVFLQPCHRLDRPVGGALILSRTSKSIERMTRLFRTNQVEKIYWAITLDCHENLSGTVSDLPLVKDRKKNLVSIEPGSSRAKMATTDYQLLATNEGYHLWELRPRTGRSHQLRVTMQHLGMPIVGDLKYGSAIGLGKYIGLHCRSMKFLHPVQKTIVEVTAPVPKMPPWDRFGEDY
nr:RluA family pseudouridine synthase [Saprospiraceae bacterium]